MNTKIKKVKVEAADVSRVYYVLVLPDGKEERFECWQDVLWKVFHSHGELYRFLGIDRFYAKLLGWEPSNTSFEGEGFERFLRAKGRFSETVLETLSLREFIEKLFEEQAK